MCKSPWQELPIYLYKDTLLQLLCARAFSKNSQDLCRMILLGRTYGKDPGQELTGSLCKGFRTRILFRGTCRIPLRGSLERIRRISVHKPSSNSKHLCARFLWRNSPDLNRPPPILGFSLCSLCKKHFGCFLPRTATNQKQKGLGRCFSTFTTSQRVEQTHSLDFEALNTKILNQFYSPEN